MAKCLICSEEMQDVVRHFVSNHNGRCGLCGEIAITNFQDFGDGYTWTNDHAPHNKICCFCGGEIRSITYGPDSWSIFCNDCGYLIDED